MKIKEILLIMKLTFVIMISAFLQVSAVTYGQKITLSERNASLEEVFKIIQAQSGYNFLYTAQMLEGAGHVNISVRNAPLESVLDKVLAGRGLSCSISRKTVVLMKRSIPTAPAFAAADTLRGKVTDTTGAPLPGVSVVVKNTQIGTATDLDGNFVLNDVPEGAVLAFSYIGFLTQELRTGSNKTLNVVLQPDLANLEELCMAHWPELEQARPHQFPGCPFEVQRRSPARRALCAGFQCQPAETRSPDPGDQR